MNAETKTYLGDSVYADFERGMIKLTTENGYGESNEIFLEPEVFQALERFAERIGWRPEQKQNL